jgi:hypothetical protein
MNVTRFLKHIPLMQERIERAKLDCLVLGLGPTAWLLNFMDPALLTGKRLFGAHDVERITRVNDLVILDQPWNELNPDGERHQKTIASRPDRFWLHSANAEPWLPLLPADVPRTTLAFHVWSGLRSTGHEPFALTDPPQTHAVSPTGCTTLAWSRGCRRIGVIGCDMMPKHHHTFASAHTVDAFFTRICREAHKAGGLILNLSPVTSLANFAAVSQAYFQEFLRAEVVPPVRNVFSNDLGAVTS